VQAHPAVIDPDVELVEQAKSGDPEAIARLYRQYEQRAYNVALRMLGNPWDAADVTQEAFIKAFGALDRFRGEARFGTWLHRIVVNAVHDHLRRRRADPLEDEVMDRLSSGSPKAGASLVGSAHGAVGPAADGLSEPLRLALLDLEEGFRLAVVLCDLLGYNYAEAAETIKSRIFRARATLSTRLREAGYEPGATGNQPSRPVVTAHATPPGTQDE
jgi:RNA polymerase sigma-70 factor (ECF subfamily)